MYETVLIKKEDRIATLVLNRPKSLNAMNQQLHAELEQAIDEVASDDETRVIVITGAGRGFSSGGDVKGMRDREDTATAGGTGSWGNLLGIRKEQLLLRATHKPTIASINGPAVGAGFDLALACDLRIASETARIAVNFVRIGMAPTGAAIWMLPRLVGLAKAYELAALGSFIDGKEAARIGLVNKAVPADQLESATMELARKLAKSAPIPLAMIKFSMEKGLTMDFPAVSKYAEYEHILSGRSKDRSEGVKAFMEKRDPIFKGW